MKYLLYINPKLIIEAMMDKNIKPLGKIILALSIFVFWFSVGYVLTWFVS